MSSRRRLVSGVEAPGVTSACRTPEGLTEAMMGDAVMERVAPVLALPEGETDASRPSGPGNAWRAAQAAGGPTSNTADAMTRAHRGWTSNLLGYAEPSDGITADIDKPNQRVWLTKTVGKDVGVNVPNLSGATSPWKLAMKLMGGGGQSGSVVDQTIVRIGVPWSRANLTSGAGALHFRAGWVAQLAGVDERAWSAAARLLEGDRTAEGELPAGFIVRGGREDLEGRRSKVSQKVLRDLTVPAGAADDVESKLTGGVKVGVSRSHDDAATSEVELRRVGTGEGSQWVLTLREERFSSDGWGGSLGFDGLSFGGSRKGTATDGDERTLVAPVQDDAAVEVLFAVVAAAHRGDEDPVGAVEGADALEHRRAQTHATTDNDQFNALSDLMRFNDGGSATWTDVIEDGVPSAYGDAHSNYDLGVGKDLGVFDASTTLASIGGDVSWAAKGDQLSMSIGGGSMSKGFGEGRDPTTVRLDTRDVEALMQYASSSQLWTRCCNDPLVSEAWQTLRSALVHTERELRGAHPEIEEADVLSPLVLNEARANAVSAFISLRAGTVDVLRTALGRDEAVVTPGVLGVLESWPAGTEALHARYNAVGDRIDALARGEWGSAAPDDTLRRLEVEANAVKSGVRALSEIPSRARLEMLGQVLQWQDQIDVAWGRLGLPVGDRADSSRHRPDSPERLEELVRRCRSEAAPHLERALSMVARDADPDAADMTNVSELAGILSMWRWAAADLARAYATAGTSPKSWMVSAGPKTERRDLDPDLDAWRRIVDHMIDHDARIPEAWVNLR